MSKEADVIDSCIIDDTTFEELETLRKRGYLSSKTLESLEYPLGDIQNQIENNVGQLVLQVTQSCNLACSYCPYANTTDNSLQRNHANKHMSLETAKKAVDFLLAHSLGCEQLSISMYGGEPLIDFELIKAIVNYANQIACGREITYNLTTNGTLVTDEMIDFFVANSINVMFSIDGPKQIHDINRRTVKGNGSFDAAFNNFVKLWNATKDAKAKPTINMVLDPENDLDEVFSLFSHPIFTNEDIVVYADMAEDDQLEKE